MRLRDLTREAGPGAAASLLHELAEGLQAVCAYLEAARRIDADGSLDPDLLQKASSQLVRVRHTYFRLRDSLLASSSGAAPLGVAVSDAPSRFVEER